MKLLLADDTGAQIVLSLNTNPDKWEKEINGLQCNLITIDSGIKCIVGLNAFLPILDISAVNVETNEDLFRLKHMEYGGSTGKNWSHVLDAFRKEFKKFGVKVNYIK